MFHKTLFMNFLLLIGAAAVVLFYATTTYAQPDTLWTRTFGGCDWDYGFSVQQTSDEGFIITGGTYSFGAGITDVYLVKADAGGNEQWSQTFGGSNYDYGYCVQQTSDGGYIIAGGAQSFGAGNSDIYLVKTDALGNQQWYNTFGGSDYDYGYSVQQTTDGGYIIAGGTYSYGAGRGDVYLVKTDAHGNQQWNQTFGGSFFDEGYSVQQTSDGGYIITGLTNSFGAGNSDVYLVKTDAQGHRQWDQTLGGNDYDYGYSVKQTSDGGYIITGSTYSFGAGSYDVYLVKTDAQGHQQWYQTFGGRIVDEGYSVQQTSDGGYIITGETYSYGADGSDVYVVKTDAQGNRRWDQTFGGSIWDEGCSVQQTSDGGYIIAGRTQSFGAGGYDVYLIRLESDSTSLVTISLTPQNPPIQIPANGGSFDFNIAIENIGTSPATFDLWTMATFPGGNEYGPIIMMNDFTAPGGFSENRDRTQYVPANAPSGDYTYDAYVGIYPDIIADGDHFEFEKLSLEDGAEFIYGWDNMGESFEDETNSDVQHPSLIIHHSASPNPFNPSTVISYEMRDASFVNLSVYDIAGREMAKLVYGWVSEGVHSAVFNAENLASGIYFYRLQAGDFTTTQKMILMK